MSKTIKIQKSIKLKEGQNKPTQKLLSQQYTKKLFNNQQSQFQITQTCKTITFKQNKMICAKKIQSKVITIQSSDLPKLKKSLEKFNIAGISGGKITAIQKLSNIPGLNNLVAFQSQSESQETIFSQIIGQAVQAICDIVDSWVFQWQDQLQNTKLAIQTVKIIQNQFQIAKKELKNIIQKRKMKLKQLNQKKYSKQMKKMKGLLNIFQNQDGQNDQNNDFDIDLEIRQLEAAELIDALFNQLPQLSDYFGYFDSSMFSTTQLNELKDLNSEVLNQIMEIDFSKANDKKKKKKSKNKKKKNSNPNPPNQNLMQINNNNNDNKSDSSSVLTTDNLHCSQVLQTNLDQIENNQDVQFKQLCQFFDKIEINFENRVQCRVTQEWMLNLEREIRYNKILSQS